MRISASALLRACLLAPLPLTAMAQAPVIVEAESGALGSSLSTGTTPEGVTYITGADNTGPPTPDRIATFEVTFPAAGNYALYARFRVGPAGGSDDSWYFSNGFGATTYTIYNTSGGGYTATGAVVIPDDPDAPGPAGTQVFKWVRLTSLAGFNGGSGPAAWVVPAGGLTQSFTWSSREDGLFMDKFAFAPIGTCYTVAELTAGSAPAPPPPPPPYTYPGPAIATGKPKFLGSAWSPGNASANFLAYFNKVSPENAGKWGSAEPTRDVFNWGQLDTAYQLAKTNGLPFHFHVLVWGNQQPNWIDELPVNEQLEEIHEWFAAVAERYPDIDILEVVNEPLHDKPCTRENGGGGYCDALGGTDVVGGPNEWKFVVTAFEMARHYFPRAKLMLNDYSIENETPQTTRYLGIIKLLQSKGLIDIIGVQGHAFSQAEPPPMTTYRSNLDRLASRGLPIQVTELDVDGNNDNVQLAGMQKIFPLYWEHPAVTGVTLWGYKQGNHWRNAQGAWLVWSNASAGAERPAMQWLHRYVNNQPTNIPFQVFTVPANAPEGSTVGTVVATDGDPGTVFSQWRIETSGGFSTVAGNGLFSINPDNGTLSVANAAALSTVPKGTVFKQHVSVWDGYQRSTVRRVEITVN